MEFVLSLDPFDLLEWLIAHHETLLHEVEATRFMIPTHMECFSDMAEMVSRISKELPERYKASRRRPRRDRIRHRQASDRLAAHELRGL